MIMLSMVFGSAVAYGLDIPPELPSALSVTGSLLVSCTNVGSMALGVFNYGALDWSPGAHNTPGLQQIGYFIPKADIETWPVIDPSTNTMTEPFVLVATKLWNPIYGTQGKGKVDFEPQGELDNESILNKAAWFTPGQKGEALAFAAQAVKDDLVYIFIEADGTQRVVGDEHFRTITKVTGSTGDAASSAKGNTLEISCIGETPAPIYSGAVAITV